MLNFGLVSMPVKLYTAVTSKSVHFNQLHGADHARVYTKRFCVADDEEVAYDELVRGYEIAPDRFVVIEDNEIDALAPEFTRTIEIEDFVELEEIDRIYLDQPYHVVPAHGGAKSYHLLSDAMLQTGKVAIARVVLRSRERLVAIRPCAGALLMTTMHYGDEVHSTSELHELDDVQMQVSERELEVARRLVRALAEPFDISRYRDSYREAVLDLVDRKAGGERVQAQPVEQRRPSETTDLIGALQASLEQARERAGGDGRGGGDALDGADEREPVGTVTGV
jgi:DNA end-binding protein Ku